MRIGFMEMKIKTHQSASMRNEKERTAYDFPILDVKIVHSTLFWEIYLNYGILLHNRRLHLFLRNNNANFRFLIILLTHFSEPI